MQCGPGPSISHEIRYQQVTFRRRTRLFTAILARIFRDMFRRMEGNSTMQSGLHTSSTGRAQPPEARIACSPALRGALIGAAVLLVAAPLYAQGTGGSPWENAVQVLQAAFTSTIARGLSLVAIVVGGLMFAFGEGQSKRVLAGIIFGVGMSIGAVNFMAWLFP